MIDFMQIMGLPLAACLVLTGIHAYLGLHVIQRQVIFVDLALAQIAVLGTSCGFLLGLDLDHPLSYALSLGFTVAGAALFAMSRFRRQLVPQEAIIGIIYVVASSLTVILLGFSGEGTEHIRQFLIGNILLVGWRDVIKILSLYTGVGLLHYFCRHKFFLITNDPQRAFQKGLNVRLWDFLFYMSFGVVVTSSVKMAGVLLVFSFLVIPAVCAMILADRLRSRLLIGWVMGTLGSLLGMIVSYFADLPTGAAVVCIFGTLLLIVALVRPRAV